MTSLDLSLIILNRTKRLYQDKETLTGQTLENHMCKMNNITDITSTKKNHKFLEG